MVLFHTFPRLMLLLLASVVLPGQSFTNPVITSQDPYLVRWLGDYYYSDSDGDTIYLRRSPTLTGLKQQVPRAIWTSPLRGRDGHANIWGPEIHEINGKWYIYFAADYHTDGRHRLYVLEGGTDPLGAYHVADTGAPNGQIVESTGRWAIDPNVFFGPDQNLYMTWSCTDDDIGKLPQSLCIARMSDALHVGSSTVRISSPTEAWETRGGAIQEGPVGFLHDGAAYLTYSANASWTTSDYAVGVLINRSGDLLDPNAWTKRGPILTSHGKAYGPGSVVFVESPDATELWGAYHAYDRLDCAAWGCRSIRMQKVTWDADGTPLMGYPVDPNVAMRVPSGEGNSATGWGDSQSGTRALGRMIYYSAASADGVEGEPQQAFHGGPDAISYEISTDVQPLTPGRVGIFAPYHDAGDYVAVFLDAARGGFGSSAVVDGTDQGDRIVALPQSFDFQLPHAIRVKKSAEQQFTFFLDGIAMDQRVVEVGRGEAGLFSRGAARFRNVTVTDTSFGWGDPYGDSAQGLPPSPVGGSARGHWSLIDAENVDSAGNGSGRQTLYRGNPNGASYTVRVEAQAGLTGSGAAPRYGLVAAYDDLNNQVTMWVDTERGMLSVNAVLQGNSTWRETALPAGFDPGAFHTLLVTKVGSQFTFSVDGAVLVAATFELTNGMTGVATEDMQAKFRRFTVFRP